MAKLLTVDEAAAAGWGHRAALYRAIKKGRIDAVGRRPAMLETCELERVYGAPKVRPDHVDDIELDRLRRENRRLRGDLDGERRRGTRLREMAAGFARTGELPPAPLWRLLVVAAWLRRISARTRAKNLLDTPEVAASAAAAGRGEGGGAGRAGAGIRR